MTWSLRACWRSRRTASVQQWEDEHIPPASGVTVARQTRGGARAVRVEFVDDQDVPKGLEEIECVPTAAFPAVS
jgi:hypothetical protein